jgi:hypothetical protein
MMLSGHQPVYLPSLHLFSKIALSDKFMFVGHCQFVNKSWHSRNVIRNGRTPLTLTVPVLKTGRFGQSISETIINGDHWKRKHLGSIRNSYQKRPYFKDYFPRLEELIQQPWENLGQMNIALIIQFLDWLNIDTPLFYSEDHAISGQKNDMLIAMCRAMGAQDYLSNMGAKAYGDESLLRAAAIDHHWQQFVPPRYEQGGEFMENLSIIDCLFNMGPASGDLVRQAGSIDPGLSTA